MSPRRRTGVVFFGYAFALIGLSLYPFQMGPPHAFLPWVSITSNRDLADVVGNVWVYVLLGALAALWFDRGWRGALWATLLGITVSLGVEYMQQWIPTRFSTGTDLAANSIGAALGAIAVWGLK